MGLLLGGGIGYNKRVITVDSKCLIRGGVQIMEPWKLNPVFRARDIGLDETALQHWKD